jgi:GNAT superfamily N-acetyltransferase
MAALPPDIAGTALLADPRLVLAPDLQGLGFGVALGDRALAPARLEGKGAAPNIASKTNRRWKYCFSLYL